MSRQEDKNQTATSALTDDLTIRCNEDDVSNSNEPRLQDEENSNFSEPSKRLKISSKLPMMISELFPKSCEEDEKQWKGPFTFIHAADCQLGMIEKYILKKTNPRWDIDMIHLNCAVKMINEITPKPKFMIIGGDMVDTPAYEDMLSIHKAQYEDFARCMEELDPEIKLLVVCGNHDVGDVPTDLTMDAYKNEFGPDFFSFWLGGVKFTIINSQYFRCPEAVPMASYMQDEFLKNIKDESAVHSVLFQHIPLFIEHEDEIDISFLNVNKTVRKPVIQKLKDAGVDYVFCGHTHRNGITSFGTSEQVLTAAIGGTFDDTKSGFRVVYVSKEKITHEYIPLNVQFKEKDDIEKLEEWSGKQLSS